MIESEHNQEGYYQHIAEIARTFLNDQRISDHDKHEVLLQTLTAAGLKPVSSIGVNEQTRNLHQDLANRLALKYRIFPPNQAGYSEMVVSRDPALLEEFVRINNTPDKQRRIGELLGYPKSAIEEFLAQTGNRPVHFWQEVVERKRVPDELLIAWQVGDMIPPRVDDQPSIAYGRSIMDFLHRIDPKFVDEFLSKGKKELLHAAQNNIKTMRI